MKLVKDAAKKLLCIFLTALKDENTKVGVQRSDQGHAKQFTHSSYVHVDKCRVGTNAESIVSHTLALSEFYW